MELLFNVCLLNAAEMLLTEVGGRLPVDSGEQH